MFRPSSRTRAALAAAIALATTTARARADEPAPAASAAPAAAPAPAAPAKPERPVKVDVGLGTEFPLGVGLQATAELPWRLLVQLEAGWMPKPYVAALDGFLKAIAVYDDATSELLRQSMKNSPVVRASLGWRPFPSHGLELLGGYTLVALGAGVGSRDLVNYALAESGKTDKRLSERDSDAEIPLHSTLHSVHVGFGWRWLVWDDRLVVRLSAQYLQTVASKTSIDLQTRSRLVNAQITEVNTALNSYMNDIYTTYVKSPVIGLTLSYRF